MSNRTIAYERIRTRDLLLDYSNIVQSIIPIQNHEGRIPIIYPWKEIDISYFIKKLFNIASNSGFEGTEEDFNKNFGSFLQGKQIKYDSMDNFPEIGEPNKLYFDTEGKILYYWDDEYLPININYLIGENYFILDGGNASDKLYDE